MRGAPDNAAYGTPHPGIIPADAGSTSVLELRQRLAPDHPRGCGEHRARPRFQSYFPGSSPRMRGAQRLQNSGMNANRIIPADAGSTTEAALTELVTGDHPRGCGEHQQTGAEHFSEAGSSPRMRGALPPMMNSR